MNNAVKILKKVSLFSIIFLILFTISCLVVPQAFLSKNQTGKFGNTLERFRDIKTYFEKDIDLLFVGASNCYRTFDNRVYREQGLESFTLGTTSQTPINSLYLTKEYLEELNPKIMVLEVSSGTFELKNGIESFLNISVNHELTSNIVKMGFKTDKLISYTTMYSEFLKRKFLKPLSKFQDVSPKTAYITGGYSEDHSTFDDIETYSLEEFKIKISEDQMEAFKSIIAFTKEKGIELVLTIQPKPSMFYQSCKNYDEYLETINEVAMKNNIRLVLPEGIKLNDQLHFADILHLNNAGAQIFNKAFLKKLRTEKIL